MATKPTTTVKPWATNVSLYPATNYADFYPWGLPNPVGGQPVPWGNKPRLDPGDITAFAAAGHTPQIPDAASSMNTWKNTVYLDCNWVEAGRNFNEVSAHIVETDVDGFTTQLQGKAEDPGMAGVWGASTGGAHGVKGSGGALATSNAGNFEAGHVDAVALVGRCAANSNAGAQGVAGFGEGDGTGVHAQANGDGYALVGVGDLGATPVRAAMRLAPQQTTPSSGAAGDAAWVSNRATNGKRRWRTAAGWESAHSTPLGRVDVIGAVEAGNIVLGGVAADLGAVAIDPEAIGRVDVTVRGTIDQSTNLTFTNIIIRDVTANLTISTQPIRAIQIAGDPTSGRDTPLYASATYDLPDAADRVFAVTLGSVGGETDYADLTVKVTGLYAVLV